MKITLGMVVLDRLSEVQDNLRRTCPYVDRSIIVDGGSKDGTLEWLRSEEARSLGIECILHKQIRLQYGNHTPTERNIYLSKTDTGPDSWLLVLDSDEFLEEAALKTLRQLALDAETSNINKICFQAHDIWTYHDGRIYDNVANYWHHSMFFKAWPRMKYVGHTHAGVARLGLPDNAAKTSLQYVHRKSEKQMLQSSCYLYWTTAKTADNVTNDPTWLKFHELLRAHGYYDWHIFKKVMLRGEVPEVIKQWFIDHKEDENPEAAAWFVYYFIFLYPSQNTQKLRSKRYKLEWDYTIAQLR